MSVGPRYVPRNPGEGDGALSSVQVLRVSDNAKFLASKIPDVRTKDVPDFAQRKDNTVLEKIYLGYYKKENDVSDPKVYTTQSRADGIPDYASYDSEEEDEKATYETKMADAILPTAGISLSRILNHPNMISLVDVVRNSQEAGNTTLAGRHSDLTIWEDMDAGSLSYIVPSGNGLPALDDKESWDVLTAVNNKRPSLPEGLCWHVLRSISRAILWLHHGVKETAGIPGEWEKRDDDWQPILIRDISPPQIWFKKPDGKKGYHYGECKLGGFHWAKVCGTPGGRLAVAERVPNTPIHKQHYWPPVSNSERLNFFPQLTSLQEIYRNTHPWTRATEIWQLGATVYAMMCGHPPSRHCDYNWTCSRMNDKAYSDFIRTIVREMLQEHPAKRPDALKLVNSIDHEYWQWREGTKAGREHVDKDDEYVKKASHTGGKGGLKNLVGNGFQGL